MRVALLVYHKNAKKIYEPHWIEQFKISILSQTYKDFDIIEVNYGTDQFRIFSNSQFYFESFENFAQCLNWMLDKCFNELGYDYVFNSNCDDYYSENWIRTELIQAVSGFDIVSSNFCLVKNNEITLFHEFHKRDIEKELDVKHNVVCHPSICYSKKFFNGNKYDPKEIPVEDMLLWTRSIKNGYKFKIVEDNLCYHRLHDNSIGHNLKEQ